MPRALCCSMRKPTPDALAGYSISGRSPRRSPMLVLPFCPAFAFLRVPLTASSNLVLPRAAMPYLYSSCISREILSSVCLRTALTHARIESRRICGRISFVAVAIVPTSVGIRGTEVQFLAGTIVASFHSGAHLDYLQRVCDPFTTRASAVRRSCVCASGFPFFVTAFPPKSRRFLLRDAAIDSQSRSNVIQQAK
ncbi:hypothetical protein ALC57_12477 [Trachymyrmex cornetzi]|uniref:Uncharacterized protein n=1 Tax=Trachymyrmex cornetzi TaxID=471704 RepID=A0A195DRD4_9HYME|nr:hypothetical protein ALC57_12477 [Trachymyrmex cornetzi]